MFIKQISGMKTLFVMDGCRSDNVVRGHNDIERVIASRAKYPIFEKSIKLALAPNAKIILLPEEK